MAHMVLPLRRARQLWLHAQRLLDAAPFGDGVEATVTAVRHLGYVQIDTIHVIERCHHHILATRIPTYRREHLHAAQSQHKQVFEYWTHALSYLPVEAYPFYHGAMRAHRRDPMRWFAGVTTRDARRVIRRIRQEGPLSIRDIEDDVLVEKDHEWASRKPSKRALQLGFFNGMLTVSARHGMLKTYELSERHFGWDRPPRAASDAAVARYLVDRALTAQGVVSADSTCHLERTHKPRVRQLLERLARRGEVVRVALDGDSRTPYFVRPDLLDADLPEASLVHLLSPFDPLVIQRDRTERFFGYRHVFEAYVPKAKRVFGYFALPVLVGDRVAAAIDLKTDREQGALLVQQWTRIGPRRAGDTRRIEEALHTFERFQLAR